MFLESRGLEVTVAGYVSSAIDLVAASAPHAAVLDYCLGLPETLVFADLLASMSIPFLFLTNPLVDVGRGAHGGAMSLEKPTPANRLASAVWDLLGVAEDTTHLRARRRGRP